MDRPNSRADQPDSTCRITPPRYVYPSYPRKGKLVPRYEDIKRARMVHSKKYLKSSVRGYVSNYRKKRPDNSKFLSVKSNNQERRGRFRASNHVKLMPNSSAHGSSFHVGHQSYLTETDRRRAELTSKSNKKVQKYLPVIPSSSMTVTLSSGSSDPLYNRMVQFRRKSCSSSPSCNQLSSTFSDFRSKESLEEVRMVYIKPETIEDKANSEDEVRIIAIRNDPEPNTDTRRKKSVRFF